LENVEILKVSENACFFVLAFIGVEVFVEMEYLGTEKIRWGGQGIIRTSQRKDPVLIKSTIRLLCCSKDDGSFNGA
jgi:hypothetical protein